jgi:hypothetical protein
MIPIDGYSGVDIVRLQCDLRISGIGRKGLGSMKVLDVVVLLPDELRARAISLAKQLSAGMSDLGHGSHFLLGEPYPDADGDAGPCEPHVSVFMLAVPDADVPAVVAATERVAAQHAALSALGQYFRHNPHGAPELYFRKSREWVELQMAVVDAVEPLRGGLLRPVDPSGADIRQLLSDPAQDSRRRHQLTRFGYDEITERWPPADDSSDRFNPHVTFAWPTAAEPMVSLAELPPAEDFSGVLSELGVFGMSPYGTCTTSYSVIPMRHSG